MDHMPERTTALEPAREPGRPATITPERVQRLASVVRAGNYLTVACRVTGLAYSTYQSWRAKGEEERRDGVTAAESPYVALVEEVEEALAAAEEVAVDAWTSAFKGDWRAAETFLARRFPDRWARGDRDPAALLTAGEVKTVVIQLGGGSPTDPDGYLLPQDDGETVDGEYREAD